MEESRLMAADKAAPLKRFDTSQYSVQFSEASLY